MTQEECIAKSAVADEQSRDCTNPAIRSCLERLAAEWRAVSVNFPPGNTGSYMLEAAE